MSEIVERELIGQKIVAIRPMTSRECNAEGWGKKRATVLCLENGILLYPSRDEEGNDAGSLFGTDGKGETFAI
jgi:hypothetical protein